MPEVVAGVVGGVDCHSRTHHAVVLDSRGQRLGDAQLPATIAGYQALHAWLEGFGAIEATGIESTSSYGAGLTRWLAGRQIRILEVNQPHQHTRSRKGKSDFVDAEAAARKVLAGEVVVVPNRHVRGDRVHPSASRGPRRGCESALRGAVSAGRPDRDRSRRTPRVAAFKDSHRTRSPLREIATGFWETC